MGRQHGKAAVAFVVVVSLGLAVSAGYYGWEQKQAADQAKREIDSTRQQFAGADTEAGKAREQAESARKELEAQRAELEQLRTERDSARAFLENEKQIGLRLREQLAAAEQQLARLGGRGGPSSSALTPQVVTSQPQAVKIAPSYGATRAVAVPAPAPAR
jgi:uncharacterized protein (DUF3084 family)